MNTTSFWLVVIGWPLLGLCVIDPPSPADPPKSLLVQWIGLAVCIALVVLAVRQSKGVFPGRASLVAAALWVGAWAAGWPLIRESLTLSMIEARQREAEPLKAIGADVHYSFGWRRWLVICSGPQWDDSRIKQLIPGMASLEVSDLDLRGSAISDAGLRELRGLKSLRFVDLRETSVSDEVIAELTSALPGLYVSRPESRASKTIEPSVGADSR
jgi:hypothetical protein